MTSEFSNWLRHVEYKCLDLTLDDARSWQATVVPKVYVGRLLRDWGVPTSLSFEDMVVLHDKVTEALRPLLHPHLFRAPSPQLCGKCQVESTDTRAVIVDDAGTEVEWCEDCSDDLRECGHCCLPVEGTLQLTDVMTSKVNPVEAKALCPSCVTSHAEECERRNCNNMAESDAMTKVYTSRAAQDWCPECRDSDTTRCDGCSEFFSSSSDLVSYYDGQDQSLCDGCSSDLRQCARCENHVTETTTVSGSEWCVRCRRTRATKCDGCNEYYSDDDHDECPNGCGAEDDDVEEDNSPDAPGPVRQRRKSAGTVGKGQYIRTAAVPEDEAPKPGSVMAPRYHGRHRVDAEDEGMHYVGCAVNPKDLKPYFVSCYPGGSFTTYVYVPTTLGEVTLVGTGFFEESGEYVRPAKVTGYPRVHTPSGVAEKGAGLGTVLYAACALTSVYMHTKYSDIPGRRNGVSSGDGASSLARRWWDSAVGVGLAEKRSNDMYVLPTVSCRKNRLYPDARENIWGVPDLWGVDDYAEMKDIILNLDLSDVLDPEAIHFFYTLAVGAGASHHEVNRMKNRAEAFRSYMSTTELPEDFDGGLVAFEDAMAAGHGVRVNPEDESKPDYKKLAKKFFPKLQGLK